MFKPTEEQVKDAMSGGRPVFKEGELVEFTVTGVNTKQADDGSDIYIVETLIDNTSNKGKKYSVWCRVGNKGGLSVLMSMLSCFMTPEEIIEGVEPAMALTGQRMSCTPKLKDSYVNWYDWRALSGAPDIGGASETADFTAGDIPF